MIPVWIVVYLVANCGYKHAPQCEAVGCSCEMKQKEFKSGLEAGLFAGNYAPYSTVIEKSVLAPPSPEFSRRVKEITTQDQILCSGFAEAQTEGPYYYGYSNVFNSCLKNLTDFMAVGKSSGTTGSERARKP